MEAASTLIDWRIGAGLWTASAMLLWLAACVSLGLLRGVHSRNPWTAGRALTGAAAAAALGCWAAHAVVMSRDPLAFPLSYGVWTIMAGLLLAFAGSAAGLWLAAQPARWPLLLAGVLLGGAACAVPAANLSALSLTEGLSWRWEVVLLTALLTSLLACASFAARPARSDRRPLARQLSASALLGAALWVANVGMVLAAGVPATARPGGLGGLGDGELTVLAVVGVPSLLAVLLMFSVVEARLKAALRRTREELMHVAQTDALTRLPNRVMFEGRLERAVARVDRLGHSLALLFVNLDGLQSVNESFGQSAGDAVLREMADRLRGLVGRGDMVARAGGDEFLLMLTGNPSQDDAAQLARRLLKSLNEPFVLQDCEVTLTCSMGVTLYPQHGGLSKLIAHAAAAMHAAKRNGGAACCFFEPDMVVSARDQADMLRDLRRAIDNGELELYYQPKIHAPSGQITGAEALMRWHHPQRGMVGPNIFIPLAERFGLIQAMGNWLIDDVCRQIRDWREEGLRMRVSINLSVHQLRQDDLVPRLVDAIQRNGIEPHVLTCEITETAAMEDTRASLKMIERLAAVGVHLSIDDFGTGYSSLSYLRQLSAGELKIDRSFVLDLESSADARAIVDAVVKLAQALGLKVVAEGVETEEQQKILRQLGCDELQGYLFAKPMSAQALSLWAMKNEGPRPLMFRPSLFGDTLSPEPLH